MAGRYKSNGELFAVAVVIAITALIVTGHSDAVAFLLLLLCVAWMML